MGNRDTPFRKGYSALKSAWDKLRGPFRPRLADTQPASAATTTAPTAPISVPPEKDQAAHTPKESVVENHFEFIPVLEVDDEIPTSIERVGPPPGPPSHTIRDDLQQESQMPLSRVEAVFARYHLELDETEWDRRPKVPHERVHKSIRMRVRYTCHNCSTTFGRDRVCVGCQHRRCSRCSRYPPRKDKPKVLQDTADDGLPQPPNNASLTNADSGTCHECQTGFEIYVEECPNCHHKICDRCIHQASITVEQSQARPSQSRPAATPDRDAEQRAPIQDESTAVS
ncbi:hypothetical protein G647_07650 [Cladophialophora carrionii CBS 160.54]|uniref:Uncharacterized protein n=1 Tax=Cladophialophora carrionii CBS 160.54 TaxID=1279043 RepID=V9D311_9EURO|nr:uncharacterized protein G647_07650 [Cladophialophora carrionii CBS 160.54]ETI21304.1 hypothetical protein G647_07650 [Cladophialophora carrionii CBS 160.54]